MECFSLQKWRTITSWCSNARIRPKLTSFHRWMCALGNTLACGLGVDIKEGMRIFHFHHTVLQMKRWESHHPCPPLFQGSHVLMRLPFPTHCLAKTRHIRNMALKPAVGTFPCALWEAGFFLQGIRLRAEMVMSITVNGAGARCVTRLWD